MLNKLGKLLKYEFRFYFRILPPIYLVIILLALFLRFQGVLSRENFVSQIFLLYFVLGALVIAMTVITLILIIQRFIDNFMKDSGYLMFSLPVTVWALLASKVIAALAIVLAGYLSVTIVGIINFIGIEGGMEIQGFAKEIQGFASDSFQYNLKDVISFIFASLFTHLLQICLVYMVITISYMLPRFRLVAAFAMYLFVTSFIGKLSFNAMNRYAEDGVSFSSLVSSLFFIAIFFFTTGFLLKRSYNLE